MRTALRWLVRAAGFGAAAYGAYVAYAWRRYGNPRRGSGGAADPLLDRFMPVYDVCDRHAIAVAASADVTIAAAKQSELGDSRIVRAIFKARELILRGRPATEAPRRGLVDEMTAIGWGILAETPREIVFGAATKPWQANPVFRGIAPEQFAAFDEPDHVKIVWTLRAEPTADGRSVFRTETRAIATDAAARRKFRPYWALLSPGIVLIRRLLLPAVRRAAEDAARVAPPAAMAPDLLHRPA